MRRLLRNRMVYISFIAYVLAIALIYGEHMAYIALYALLLLPLFSLIVSFVCLRFLDITQSADEPVVVKEDGWSFYARVRNRSPLMFSSIEYLVTDDSDFFCDSFYPKTLSAEPFCKKVYQFKCRFIYRGNFLMGVKAVRVMDVLGLFMLRKKVRLPVFDVTVLPLLAEIHSFPIEISSMPQEMQCSRFDINEEDYENISDIRGYLPADSMKRIHWKLSAKRSEWMVKEYRANASNKMYIIVDVEASINNNPVADRHDKLSTEDIIVGNSLALMQYYLKHSIPVRIITTNGVTITRHEPSGMESALMESAGIAFVDETGENRTITLLRKVTDENNGFVNAVILTQKPDALLGECIISMNRAGNNVVLLYFPCREPDENCEYVYNAMAAAGVTVRRITNRPVLKSQISVF